MQSKEMRLNSLLFLCAGLVAQSLVCANALAQTDSDLDGVLDRADLDDDNDGIPDWAEGDGLVDSDRDGVVDALDLDSDNDGLDDIVEAGFGALDTDGDGRGDAEVGTDGLMNELETSIDSGISRLCGDGTTLVANGSFEMPGVPGAAAFRLVPEGSVAGWSTSAGDNLIELWDSGHRGVESSDGSHHAEVNGTEPATLSQTVATTSGRLYSIRFAHRGRREPETLAVHADDGVLRAVTTDVGAWSHYSSSFVATGASTIVAFESAGPAGGSANFLDDVAVYESCRGVDGDGDGIPSYLDLDADGDGITDAFESAAADENSDGRLDGCAMVNAEGQCPRGLVGEPVDTDDDGVADYLDTDSDGDGLSDTVEAFDRDGDGSLDGESAALGTDEDADGLDDAFDPDASGSAPLEPATVEDEDGDGTPDWLQVCGDRYVTGSEMCDDGNTDAGDGCSALCQVEPDDTCASDTDCPVTAPYCDDALNLCVECTADDHCPDDGVCSDARVCEDPPAGCVDDDDCAGDTPFCDDALDRCVECTDDGQCDDGVCNDSVCEDVPAACADDRDCAAGFVCDPDVMECVRAPDGMECGETRCGGTTPICIAETMTCVECVQNGDCRIGLCDQERNVCLDPTLGGVTGGAFCAVQPSNNTSSFPVVVVCLGIALVSRRRR